VGGWGVGGGGWGGWGVRGAGCGMRAGGRRGRGRGLRGTASLGRVTRPQEQAPLHAPIVAVTVYPDRARVTRRLVARVPAGDHRVHIGPLPMSLDRDSVRVGGRGPVTVLGVDVVTHHEPRSADATVAELEEQRRALAAELAAVDDADEVEVSRAGFVDQLAQRAGGTYARALAAGQVDVAAVTAFADAVADQLTAGRARRRELTGSRELLQDRLAAVERRLAEAGKGRRQPDRLAAVITVAAADGQTDTAEVQLELSYVVEGAGWQSSYDIRLDEGGDAPATQAPATPAQPGLTLTWFGLVSQQTGEDWPECELRLSTARPAAASTVPELEPWFLDRVRPLPAPPVGLARGRALTAMAYQAGQPEPVQAMSLGLAAEDAAAGGPVVESVATAEQGVAAATYRPARPIAVPADGAAHRATVAVLELPVTLDYVTAPVQAAEAHLRAVVTNGSAHTLLPGRAGVFHGADFVGGSELPVWAPGEEVELALGVDDRIRVERKLTRRSATKATLSAVRRRDVEHRITVANHTPAPARITVLDQAPVSRDDGITVRETLSDPAPDERTELGVLTWRLELPPGGQREIALGVRVEVAKGVEVAGWRE